MAAPQYTDAPTLAIQELLDLLRLQQLANKARAPERTAAQYIDDPLGFVDHCVAFPVSRRAGKSAKPAGLASYQREIMASLPEKHRVAVRGPRGLGKSTSAALILLWFALTRDAAGVDWKVVTTAGSWSQITSYLWPEIKKWSYCLNWDAIGRGPFSERSELMKTGLSLRHGLAMAGSPDQPEKLEGAHADSVLYIFDESKIVAPQTFDAAEGAFSGAGGDTGLEAFAIAISTPGSPAGRFYDIHRHAPGLEDWHTRHVTLDEAIAAGRMTRAWAAQRKKLWGEASALYQNHVLGEFCSEDEDAIIPLAWIEAAQERWTAWDAEGRPDQDGQHTVGVDVARSGLDKSVAAVRHGDVLTHLVTWSREDTMATVGRVKGILDADPAATAIIDVIGIGAGVYDRLREMGTKVDPFNASKKTTRRDVTRQFGFMNCLTGDARAAPIGELVRVYRARHEGAVFRVQMASGDEFTTTPHHNVLTLRGWVPVKSLSVGDKLCNAGGSEWMTSGDPDVGGMPPKIGEIYAAARQVFGSKRVRGGTVDFHGDHPVGEVEVVTIDRELLGLGPADGERVLDEEFVGLLHAEATLTPDRSVSHPVRILDLDEGGEYRLTPRSLRKVCDLPAFDDGAWLKTVFAEDAIEIAVTRPVKPAQGVHGFTGLVAPDEVVRVNASLSGKFNSFGPRPDFDAVLTEDFADGNVGGSVELAQRLNRLACEITLDEIVDIDVTFMALHEDSFVYTLQTTTGAYRTAHAVHRNCRSAAWWNLRELLDPSRGSTIALPPDDELAGDLTALHKKYMSEGKIQAEAKDDVKKRIGRSTDRGDAVVQAFFTVAGSFHDVYGTEMCPNEKCGRGFARNVKGKPRERCPYCNTVLETEEDEVLDGDLVLPG